MVLRRSSPLWLLPLLFAVASPGNASDWPQWRGPERDGSIPATELADVQWPTELERLWRVELGGGHSSPVVADGRVYLHSRHGDDEVFEAYDLADGRRLWSDRYPAPFETNSYAGDHGKGPYATPLVDGDRVYALGVNATMSAYDTATGELVWRLDPTGGAVDSSKLFCGTAGSPMMVNGAVVAYVGDDRGGEILSVDAGSGQVRWRWRGDGPGYASPIVTEIDGAAQIVTLSDRSVIALDAESGSLLWRLEFPDEWNENVVTPLALGDRLLYSGVRNGTSMVRPRRTAEGWSVETVWQSKDLTMYLSSPVEIGGTIVGLSNKLKGHLFRADPASGDLLWQGEGRFADSASLIHAGETLLVATTDGRLLVYDAGETEPTLIATYQLADTAVWAHPAVADGVLLVRDGKGLSAWRLPAEKTTALEAFIQSYVDLAMFDGTVLIDRGGEIVYERSFGFADYEQAVPHGPETRFRIASVSKALTDAAIAVMIERGELTLDTPIANFLPDFPSADKITVGHLLDYSSGIPHSNDQPWGDGNTSLTLDEIVDRLAALPLDFEPGTSRSYSNGGYAVAAKILALAGGGSYASVMRDTLFEPLGMADTDHIDDARAAIPHLAFGYEPGRYPGERRHSRFYAVETRPGGGSLYSTPHDLLRFARAVFRRDFIPEALRESVLGADEDGYLAQGRSPGCVAKFLYDPKRDLIVISLANNYAVPADWAAALADLATGRPPSRPWLPFTPAAASTVADDDARLGRYSNSRGGDELTIRRSERGVMLLEDARGDSSIALVPLEGGGFLLPIYFQLCEPDPETRVITCRILSGDPRYVNQLTPTDG